MDTKKIGVFMKSLDDAEFIYLDYVVGFRKALNSLKLKSKLDNAEFANRLGVPVKKLDNFMKGDYKYTLMEISAMNYLAKQVAIEAASETEIVSVAKSDYKYSKPIENDPKKGG